MIPIHAFIVNFLAADTAQAPDGFQKFIGNGMFFPVIMIVMFYFLMFRPQQLQRKEIAARIAALQSGDRVITTSGIHGIVHNVKESTVVVKVSEGTMLEFDKPAIASVKKKDAA